MKKQDFDKKQWDLIKCEMRTILIEWARIGKTISYKALTSRMSLLTIQYDQPDQRHVLAQLLGEISCSEVATGKPMLSAIVTRAQGDKQPGEGFFKFAKDLGFKFTDKTEFWINQLNRTFVEYKTT